MRSSIAAKWRSNLRVAAFVYLSALLMMVASERVYWYWSGLTVDSVLLLAGLYSLAAAAGLWTLGHTGSSRLHQIILGGAVFAFVVEGVITPVIYEDGPLPMMAAMFVGWHGMLGFVGFWFLARRWLLDRQWRRLATTAGAVGAVWGIWARTSAVGDELDMAAIAEGFDPTILSPLDFTAYAVGVGAVFVVGHWLIGYVWPDGWRPGRRSTQLIVLLAAAYMAVAVLPAVIWAPAKLAALLGLTLWLLRRSQTPEEPAPFSALRGRVRLREAAVLLVMPVAAAATYWLVDGAGLEDGGLVAIYWTLVDGQIAGGAAAYWWAARRAVRRAIPTWAEPTIAPRVVER